MAGSGPRLLILGAHPDDAEFSGGGIASLYRQMGRTVKMVSVTNGAVGHYERPANELIPMRRSEAAEAGRVIGATYDTWDFPDGRLEPTLEVRHRIIREVREFKPDLVLTHRTCDYHPDHRAVGQCVQDAVYLATVPRILPEVPAITKSPVIAYLPDLFTRPTPLRADVVLDITAQVDQIVAMLACQRSQVFEWLAYEEGILDTIPSEEDARIDWLRGWYLKHITPRRDRFQPDVSRLFGEDRSREIQFVEVFELSEYGELPSASLCGELFPTAGLAMNNGAMSNGTPSNGSASNGSPSNGDSNNGDTSNGNDTSPTPRY